MECTVHLLAGMPVCYIYRQQEGLTERTPAWATSRRPTDEVRSSSHSRSASTTRSFVNGWSFRLSFATRPGYDGDHEDISDGDSYELGEYENSEEALAAAEAFISTHGNEVNDEEDGIGSVIYWTVEVERRVEYKENEWLPCDESGRIDDGYGNEPNATVAYLSSLEGSREERAFELAKNEYLAWLEHKADRYTTVYGYMD